jgi:hypothetical protein
MRSLFLLVTEQTTLTAHQYEGKSSMNWKQSFPVAVYQSRVIQLLRCYTSQKFRSKKKKGKTIYNVGSSKINGQRLGRQAVFVVLELIAQAQLVVHVIPLFKELQKS